LLHLLVARQQRVLSLELELPSSDSQCSGISLSLQDKAPARAQSLRRAWMAG
jgi:hypothetical protein